MRNNRFDLFEGNISYDQLKAIAIRLEIKYDESIHSLGDLISGLHPSILPMLKYDIKFKNLDGLSKEDLLKELNQKEDFKTTLFHVNILRCIITEIISEQIMQFFIMEKKLKEITIQRFPKMMRSYIIHFFKMKPAWKFCNAIPSCYATKSD